MRAVVAAAPDIIPVTDTVRASFDTDIINWFTALQALISNKYTLREARYYDVPATAGVDMGGPKRVTTLGMVGTSSTNCLPPQCAASVTFKTSVRKQWGRSYVPGLTVSSIDANGRLTSSARSTLLSAFQILTGRGGTGGAMTIFSRVHWAHNDPVTVQVDDIVDVIRRRRFSTANARTVGNA